MAHRSCHWPLDVNDEEDVYKTVDNAAKHFGRIDVLVNNAGFGIVGAAEAFTEEQVRSQLETNLYAPINITRAVLPYMRKRGEWPHPADQFYRRPCRQCRSDHLPGC